MWPGLVSLEEEKLQFRVSRSGSQTACSLPLSRAKCEELANYYLGFSGWSSEILYHRREEGPEVEPGTLCYVTVVKLLFSQVGGEFQINEILNLFSFSPVWTAKERGSARHQRRT